MPHRRLLALVLVGTACGSSEPAPPPVTTVVTPTPMQLTASVLEVTSQPAGAHVFVDGSEVDLTPTFFTVTPGAHAVQLTLPDHGSVSLVVDADQSRVRLPEVHLARTRTRVTVSSVPPAEARLTRGSRTYESCRTPCTLPVLVEQGPFVLEVEAPEHARWSAPLDPAVPDVRVVLDRLGPTTELVSTVPASLDGESTLILNSAPWSTVTVDGRPVGNTPIRNLRVSAGSHSVRFQNGLIPEQVETRRITVEEGRSVPVVVRFHD